MSWLPSAPLRNYLWWPSFYLHACFLCLFSKFWTLISKVITLYYNNLDDNFLSYHNEVILFGIWNNLLSTPLSRAFLRKKQRFLINQRHLLQRFNLAITKIHPQTKTPGYKKILTILYFPQNITQILKTPHLPQKQNS